MTEFTAASAETITRLPPPAKTRHGSERRQRGHTVHVRFDDDELARLEERAGDAGLSLAAYLRACALGAAGPRSRRRASVDRLLLAQTHAALSRIGNNLNQIAHALNSRGETPIGADIAVMRTASLATLAEIRRALGRDREG